jgi:hypothetical protein
VRKPVVLFFLCAAAMAADAQFLYKWTDKEGKTQYSDQVPKNPAGEVTRIEIDTPPAPFTPPAAHAPQAVPGPADIAAKRRATRAALETKVAKARVKRDAARAALNDAAPDDTEKQVIQQRQDHENPGTGPGSRSTGGMLGQGGMLGAAPRMNCREEGKTVICPTTVPSEGYYERVQQLEDDLRKAEEELSTAEQAYRRGVD